MRIIGLDLSLTATGLALPDDSLETIRVKLPEHALEERRVERLRDLCALIDRRTRDSDMAVLEGYAYSRSGAAHSLGELGGVVKVCLLQRGVRFVCPGSTVVKKYATGNGGAGKDRVLAAAIKDAIRRQLPEPSGDDEADAYWLRRMALDHYGEEEVNADRRHLLDAITWPTFDRED